MHPDAPRGRYVGNQRQGKGSGKTPSVVPRLASQALPVPQPIAVMDVPVAPFESYEQAMKCVGDILESGRKAFWVAINPQKIYRAWHDPKLLDIVRRADAAICDGVGVSLAAKILHGRVIKRCTGCDLFFALLAEAARKGWRVFLLGASPESNRGACSRLREAYPGLMIAGSRDGYFTDSSAVIAEINASRPDMLFVAMGSPRQEYWIAEHHDEIHAGFCLGVGGSFDIASGAARRAPGLFRKTGTEFLYQLLTEPRKRLKRQLVYFPYMIRVVGRALLDRSGNGRRKPRGVAPTGPAGQGDQRAGLA